MSATSAAPDPLGRLSGGAANEKYSVDNLQDWDAPKRSSEQLETIVRYPKQFLQSTFVKSVCLAPGRDPTKENLLVLQGNSQLDVYLGSQPTKHLEKKLPTGRPKTKLHNATGIKEFWGELSIVDLLAHGSSEVTCMAVSHMSDYLWVGRADGVLMAFSMRDAKPHLIAADYCSSSSRSDNRAGPATCSLAVDGSSGRPRCWVGDAVGDVFTMQLDEVGKKLDLKLHSGSLACSPWPGLYDRGQPSPSRILPPHVLSSTPKAVTALLNLGKYVLSSGGSSSKDATGRARHWLVLWDTKTLERQSPEAVCTYGAVTCVALLDSTTLQPRTSNALSSCQSSTHKPSTSSCRVLSAHEHTQVMLWEVQAVRGRKARLQEVASIQVPSGFDGEIKRIFTFPDWNMLVLVQNDHAQNKTTGVGRVNVMQLPSLEHVMQAYRDPAAAMQGCPPTLRGLKHILCHSAHKGAIVDADCVHGTFVTASRTTVRRWTPKQLAELAKQYSSSSSDVDSADTAVISPTPFITVQLSSSQKYKSSEQLPWLQGQRQHNAALASGSSSWQQPEVAGSLEGRILQSAGPADGFQPQPMPRTHQRQPPLHHTPLEMHTSSQMLSIPQVTAGRSGVEPAKSLYSFPGSATYPGAVSAVSDECGEVQQQQITSPGTPPSSSKRAEAEQGALLPPCSWDLGEPAERKQQHSRQCLSQRFGALYENVTHDTNPAALAAEVERLHTTEGLRRTPRQDTHDSAGSMGQCSAGGKTQTKGMQGPSQPAAAGAQTTLKVPNTTCAAAAGSFVADTADFDARRLAECQQYGIQPSQVDTEKLQQKQESVAQLKQWHEQQMWGKLGLPEMVLQAAGMPEVTQLEGQADSKAHILAELAAHAGYTYVRQLPDRSMFKGSRALQVRCNKSNRLRTLLQMPCRQLLHLRRTHPEGFKQLQEHLVEASSLYHPHMLQVYEVFSGPLHLHIVLEECSAGRLLDFPSKQARAWATAEEGAAEPERVGAGAAGRPPALTLDFARWFFQQVVLAVDYYHTCSRSGGREPSQLLIKETLLKEAALLPQPVVKVLPAVLARALSAVQPCSDSCPGAEHDPFIPPEAYSTLHAGAARHDTPEADVWACGILLLQLLGGRLQDHVHLIDTSKPVSHAELFVLTLPGAEHLVPEGASPKGKQRDTAAGCSGQPAQSSPAAQVVDLLTKMLQPRAVNRITLRKILEDDPWFKEGLPANAGSMTQRYAAMPRACRQSDDDIRATVLMAALSSREQLGVVQQLTACPQLWMLNTSEQQDQEQCQHQGGGADDVLQLLRCNQGPASVHSLHGLQLQLQALKQLALQLASTSQAPATEVHPTCTRPAELIVAAAAVTSAVQCFQCLQQAVLVLQQARPGLSSCLSGELMVLQLLCSDALYALSWLHQLVSSPQHQRVWRWLQDNRFGCHKPAAVSISSISFQQLRHRLGLHLYLLLHAHRAVHGLGICAVAAQKISGKVSSRWRSPVQAAQVVRRPCLLTAVLRNSILADCLQQSLQVVGACITSVRQLPGDGSSSQQATSVLWQSYAKSPGKLLPVYVGALLLLLVHLGNSKRPPKLQRSAILQVFQSIEDMNCIKVDRLQAPQQHDASPAGIVAFKGVLVQPPSPSQQLGLAVDTDKERELSIITLSQLVEDETAVQRRLLARKQRSHDAAHASRRELAGKSRFLLCCEHPVLAAAAQPCSDEALQRLSQALQKLQDSQLLNTDSTATSLSNQHGAPLLAPIHSLCLDPPVLVVPQYSCRTLQQWLTSNPPAQPVALKNHPWMLELLGRVAAGLWELHKQQPPMVHGGVHAAAVCLASDCPGGEAQGADDDQRQGQVPMPPSSSAMLSLVPLFAQLSPISSVHPLLSAPELLLASGPASLAADVYGFGILMFQLASGWVPQQYIAGSNDQVCAVLWTREMLHQLGSTSPLAAVQGLLSQQQQQQQVQKARDEKQLQLPQPYGAASVQLTTGSWTPYGDCMPPSTALLLLPDGYVCLMEQCLSSVAPARPSMQEVVVRLQAMKMQQEPAGRPVMVAALSELEQGGKACHAAMVDTTGARDGTPHGRSAPTHKSEGSPDPARLHIHTRN